MAVTLDFINQSAPDIKKKLQKLEHLGEKSIRNLIVAAQKVFNERDSVKEKEIKKEQWRNQHLASILLAATAEPDERRQQL